MDSNQLHELALNARLGHWPAHLGVKTEAEKIEYLARQLGEAANDLGDRSDDCPQCSICDVHGSKENDELTVDANDVISVHKKLTGTLKDLRDGNLSKVSDYLDQLEYNLDELKALALP